MAGPSEPNPETQPSQTPFDAHERPITRVSLSEDLRQLGVAPGMTLLVHASLSRVGWVFGKSQAVIEALLDVLGPTGTLMMPTHSSDLTEPSRWQAPPVPELWQQIIRDEMPVWDPARTPTRAMGALAEAFRSWPGAARSNHPYGSFAALGPHAAELLADHAPGCAFGEASPIGALNRRDGWVLLLGVGHGNNTSLHLAEYRATWPGKHSHEEGAPLMVAGERRWATFTELAHDDDDFVILGAEFDATAGVDLRTGPVGKATARLLRQRPLVAFARDYMQAHRR